MIELPPECPDWCVVLDVEHLTTYTDRDAASELVREHSVDVGSVTIVQRERVGYDGVVSLGPAVIHSWVQEQNDLTAERARQIAADFTAAADQLEVINAA